MPGGEKKSLQIGELRERLRALDRIGGGRRPTHRFGLPELDRALGGGLATGCLHEVAGALDDGAATGFVAALAAGLAGETGAVLWCLPRPDLYGPGLAAAGLDLARLIVLRAPRPADCLWAMEEGARSGALAAAVGEVDKLSLTAARRLQLASETGGVTAFLLRAAGGTEDAAAVAATRWRVAAAPSSEAADSAAGRPRPWPGLPRWQVDLRRCRGGRPGRWILSWQEGAWRDAAGDLAVAAPLRHRPAAAEAGA
jgi:protein ImuA